MMKLSLVIPCYNEEEGIDNLARRLNPVLDQLEKEYSLEVIFIDDGSKDNTYSLLTSIFGKRKGVKIIQHSVNQNLGAAMRTGFQNSTGEVIVTMDSDCTYGPENIPAMVKLLDSEVSLVTASPYHPLGGINNVPRYRIFLSKSITQLYRTLTGANIYTFTALFRAQKKEVVQNVTFKSNNFLATAEMLIYALMKGYKVKEFPLVLNVREFGESKMKLFSVIWSHFKFVTALAGLRLTGKLKKTSPLATPAHEK